MPLPPLIPLGHLFDNPERAAPRLSPDGRRIAFLAPRDGLLNVWVRPIDSEEAVPVTHDTQRGVGAYFWSRDSRHILFMRDSGGDENYHVIAADPADPDAPDRDLTPFPGVKVGIVDVPRATPGHILISTNRREPGLFDVERLDLATGETEPVAENPGNVQGWLADRDGRVRVAVTQTPSGDSEILIRDDEASPFRVLAEFANEDGGHPYAFSADGGELYVGSARDRDLSALVALDCATGDERLIDVDEVADIGGPILSDRTGDLLGVTYLRDRDVVKAFDPELQEDVDALRAVHSGDPAITSQDAEERMWIVGFDDDRDPGAAYLYDRDTKRATLLFRSRPWLDPEHLAPMEPVKIASRDGRTLWSYLTLPVGVERANLPMILYVHGGPWSRDAWGYEPLVQLFANRGYAVLQVNYRGSTGFGKDFMHAAEREFAGKMHDDLIDAVDWAIAEGIADPKRIGIHGGSYGGYATLVGVTFTPDRFAAAVSYVGPSSLVTLVRSFPAYWRPFLEGSWYRFVGDPEDPAEHDDLVRRSPLTYVDRIETPLMVVQGRNDPRVTKVESDQIVQALRKRGVPVRYIVADDEGHGFVKPANRLRLVRAMEEFFATHLGGRDAGPP